MIYIKLTILYYTIDYDEWFGLLFYLNLFDNKILRTNNGLFNKKKHFNIFHNE